VGAVSTFFRKVTRWPFIRQVLLYGVFGAFAAGADFCLFLVLREFGLPLLAANMVSVNVGIAISFVCNSFLNFRRTDRFWRRAALFFCVGWSGLLLSSAILEVGVTRMGLREIWVKAASIVVVAAYQFTLNKLVTFRAARADAAGGHHEPAGPGPDAKADGAGGAGRAASSKLVDTAHKEAS
jgi:putative flippase GtrA